MKSYTEHIAFEFDSARSPNRTDRRQSLRNPNTTTNSSSRNTLRHRCRSNTRSSPMPTKCTPRVRVRRVPTLITHRSRRSFRRRRCRSRRTKRPSVEPIRDRNISSSSSRKHTKRHVPVRICRSWPISRLSISSSSRSRSNWSVSRSRSSNNTLDRRRRSRDAAPACWTNLPKTLHCRRVDHPHCTTSPIPTTENAYSHDMTGLMVASECHAHV